ncbi:hypothetical protein RCH10_004179 [Variovorax sp. GrIS 2.14]|uniref:hypothetical protein n=1 Tax=Variovorax sp. GrIS 2.14 TaxID=3071709 RepID=UPI0038F70587
MGVSACVYCNCLEKGLLTSQPKAEWNVYVDSDGSRSTQAIDLEAELEFDRWNESACGHEFGVYARASIGNVSLAGMLRKMLSAKEIGKIYPVLLGHVLYNGTHGGDSVPMELMPQLQAEVFQLAGVRCDEQSVEAFLRGFEQTMQALCVDAKALGRPICF